VNTPLAREPLRLVLPAGHRLAGAGLLRPADVEGVPYIALARGMGTTSEAQRFFASGEGYPSPVVEVNDTRLVLDLVVHFSGYGIVPVSVLSDDSTTSSNTAAVVAIPTDPPLVR
jgi:DNA-binding transcriptional LysR family regulator